MLLVMSLDEKGSNQTLGGLCCLLDLELLPQSQEST